MGTHTHIKAFSYIITQINGCQQLFYNSKKVGNQRIIPRFPAFLMFIFSLFL